MFRSSGSNPGSPADNPAGGGHIVQIWLGRSGLDRQAQDAAIDCAGQDFLFGSGEVPRVGPGPAAGSARHIEFLVPVRFRQPFRTRPRLICTLSEDEAAACDCDLTSRDLTSSGFTLVFVPHPGSARRACAYAWAALGHVLPLPPADAGRPLFS